MMKLNFLEKTSEERQEPIERTYFNTVLVTVEEGDFVDNVYKTTTKILHNGLKCALSTSSGHLPLIEKFNLHTSDQVVVMFTNPQALIPFNARIIDLATNEEYIHAKVCRIYDSHQEIYLLKRSEEMEEE